MLDPLISTPPQLHSTPSGIDPLIWQSGAGSRGTFPVRGSITLPET